MSDIVILRNMHAPVRDVNERLYSDVLAAHTEELRKLLEEMSDKCSVSASFLEEKQLERLLRAVELFVTFLSKESSAVT
jgi:hypothetical protein